MNPDNATDWNFPNDSSAEINETFFHPMPTLVQSDLYKIVILIVLGVLATFGNALTIKSVRKLNRSGSTMHRLISQLAIADILVALFGLITEGTWTYTVQWYGGNILCKIVKFLQMFCLYSSTFITVLIGVDRLTAIRYPLFKERFRKSFKYAIIVSWCLSGLFSIPQAVIFRVEKGPFKEDFFQCVTNPNIPKWQMKIYTTFTFVIMFLIPLIILILTYSCTFYTISSSEKLFRMKTTDMQTSRIESTREKVLHKAKIRSLKISIVIVVAFVVCWTPYYIMMITFMFLKPDPAVMEMMTAGIFFFGSSTALINPLIYGAFHLHRKRRRRTQMLNSSINSAAPNNMHSKSSRMAQTERFNMSVNGSSYKFVGNKSLCKKQVVTSNVNVCNDVSQSFL